MARTRPANGPLPVSAVRLRAKAVKRGQRAARSDFEDRATPGEPASRSCPVEVPVDSLDQGTKIGISTVGPVKTHQSLEVCAGEAITTAAQNARTTKATFDKLSVLILLPSRSDYELIN